MEIKADGSDEKLTVQLREVENGYDGRFSLADVPDGSKADMLEGTAYIEWLQPSTGLVYSIVELGSTSCTL